ncbi:MAG: DUF6476 family protein [Pseudomonadota bacterium]
MNAPHKDAPQPVGGDEDVPEPPALRRLRLLVTVLTSVLIIGMLTMIVVFVIQVLGVAGQGPAPQGGVSAEEITLPAGEQITAIGRGRATLLITTEGAGGETLRIFDAATGAPLSSTLIRRTPD